jgi:hypothetical protein
VDVGTSLPQRIPLSTREAIGHVRLALLTDRLQGIEKKRTKIKRRDGRILFYMKRIRRK